MPGFLDTTIVVDVACKREPSTSWANKFATANGPVECPEYALRELLAGVVQQLCDAHNRVKAAQNPAEAICAVLQSGGFHARTSMSKAAEIANALSVSFAANSEISPENAKREVAQALRLKANGMWRSGKKIPFAVAVQPLACFKNGSLHDDPVTGALMGPGGSFTCKRTERCSAALYMNEKQIDLKKLIDALHPDNLDAKLSAKQENSSRRAALKELLARGPKDFHKGKCRALGDAYFVLMSPPGAAVMSTNSSDHAPLCNSLGKTLISP